MYGALQMLLFLLSSVCESTDLLGKIWVGPAEVALLPDLLSIRLSFSHRGTRKHCTFSNNSSLLQNIKRVTSCRSGEEILSPPLSWLFTLFVCREGKSFKNPHIVCSCWVNQSLTLQKVVATMGKSSILWLFQLIEINLGLNLVTNY